MPMKYVIPIAVEIEDAVKLLGALPPTASATRTELARKVAEIIKNYEPTVAKKETPVVEEEETPSETVETPKKTAKKSAKKASK